MLRIVHETKTGELVRTSIEQAESAHYSDDAPGGALLILRDASERFVAAFDAHKVLQIENREYHTIKV